MQEVFENIMQRLENEVFSAELYGEKWNGQTVTNLLCLGNVRDVIEQVSAEYNGGWIPVEERLPEEPEKTSDVEGDIYNERLTEYIVTIKGAEKATILYYAGDGYWYDEGTQEYYPVTAWQPLPGPYQPKDRLKEGGQEAGVQGNQDLLMTAT